MAVAPNAAFQALADQTRRDILRVLRGGPRTSGEIAARFASSWPTISRHLAVLRHARLVRARREGQEIHYELNTSVFQDLVQHLIEWVTPAGGRHAKRKASRHNRRRLRREHRGGLQAAGSDG
jgi:DNA-binding transcriptional ArsR family regulator